MMAQETAAQLQGKLAAARRGNRQAQDELIRANMGLVQKIAWRFGQGPESEDVFQSGCIGLWKAVERYDPNYGAKFSTYAVSLIVGEIRRYLRDTAAAGQGRKAVEQGRQIRVVTENLRQGLGREPTVGEVAGHMGVSVAELALGIDALAANLPLEEADPGGGDDASWQEKALLRRSLGELDGQEKELILWRYFRDRTQSETGACLGLSQVQVCRLEKRVLEKLRRKLV